MVRTDLLRAKSLHAEVGYLRDLQRVGEAKRQEQSDKLHCKEKEKAFWKEAVKARGLTSDAKVAGTPNNAQAAANLDRIWRAHSQLKEAHRKHESSAKTLQADLQVLSGSKKRIELLQGMVAKAERARANQIESRLSEEVAELASTAKAISNLRRPTTEKGDIKLDDPISNTLRSELAASDKAREATQAALAATMPQPVSAASNIANLTPIKGVEPLRATGAVDIQNVTFHRGDNQAALSLQCALGNHGTVGVSIVKGDNAGLKVVVDPGSGVTASALLKDRAAIQSRLGALGIKVASIEVGQSDPMPLGNRNGSRKLSKDDEYEDTFA